MAEVRPDRAATRLVTRVRDEPAAAALGVAIAVWTIVFSTLVVLRQERYRTIRVDAIRPSAIGHVFAALWQPAQLRLKLIDRD